MNQKSPIRVLHVEDSVGDLELTRLFLKRQGYNNIIITPVLSAEQALEILEQKDFDVVVSDYQMPRMNGLEFLEELRKKGNDIPFIIFTGKGEEQVAMEALNKGANRYISKDGAPAGPIEELGRYIQEVVEERQREKESKKEKEPDKESKLLSHSKRIKDLEVTETYLREHLDIIILGLLADRSDDGGYKIMSERDLIEEIHRNFGIQVKPEALHSSLNKLKGKERVIDVSKKGVMWDA
jgi:DNA-binding NtrC family response regulator